MPLHQPFQDRCIPPECGHGLYDIWGRQGEFKRCKALRQARSIKVFVGGAKAKNLDKNIAATDYEKAKEVKFAMTGQFVLSKEWQTYEVDLENADLSAVTHAFAFEVLKGAGNERQVVYLDSILYIE